eukprot:3238813-Prorocentrum_lima.AAC.1
MTSSLVGSEMCIRDRAWSGASARAAAQQRRSMARIDTHLHLWTALFCFCLLYTSDAADDM